MSVPLRCHRYDSGAVPAATTVKVALAPTAATALAGGVVMLGATAAAVTVSVAPVLVTLPLALPTTTLNTAPESPTAVAASV
jgi:hypothetical protein